ncbi:MAG: single-stranded DNA-binding protein [Armatimonadota bacterium]
MINNVVLVGRLATDPEMKYAQSGTEITTFRIAVSRPPRENQQQDTDFLNVVCFGNVAQNVANYLDKGSLVGIEGRIQTRSYDQDGRRQWWTEINARNIQFLESRQEAERRRAQEGRTGPPEQTAGAPQGGQTYGGSAGGQQPQQKQQGQQNQSQETPPPPAEFDDMDENNDPFGDV